MFTGVKVNQKTIGLDARHNLDDTSYCSSNDTSERMGLESLATWAQNAGKYTGNMFIFDKNDWAKRIRYVNSRYVRENVRVHSLYVYKLYNA